MRHLLAISTFVCVLLVACSGGKSDGKGAAAPVDTSADDENAPADKPQQVSGAFLHCAAIDDPEGITVAEGERVVGCLFKDEDGARVEIEPDRVQGLEIVTASGVKTPETIKPGDDTPWTVFFKLAASELDALTSIVVKFLDDIGASMTAQTDNADYDYKNDPIFNDSENIGAGILYERYGEVLKDVERPTKDLAPVPADAAHLIFATHKLFWPDFGGLAGADAHCVEAGARVDASKTWVALLSTSKVHARDRVEIKGKVYNLMAELVALDGAMLWSAWHPGKVRYSERGSDTQAYWIDLLKVKISRVWSGSDDEGRYNAEKGACKDWTSKVFADRAAVGTSDQRGAAWIHLDRETVSCSHMARLFCISR